MMKRDTGVWVMDKHILICSNCGHVIGNARVPNYCSQCGSKMIEVKENENEFSSNYRKNNKGL